MEAPSIKLLMLGDSGVGKSCLMMRFADEKFMVTMIATAGVDFKVKQVKIDGRDVCLRIWDTAGQERFKTITRQYYRGAMGIILVYDVCDRKSFDHVKYWMTNIETYANDNVSKVLVGNKVDLTDKRELSTDEGLKLAGQYKVKFMEASAKTNQNVTEVFTTIAKEIMTNIEAFAPTEGVHTIPVTNPSSGSCCGGGSPPPS